jgi:hypothetical protein
MWFTNKDVLFYAISAQSTGGAVWFQAMTQKQWATNGLWQSEMMDVSQSQLESQNGTIPHSSYLCLHIVWLITIYETNLRPRPVSPNVNLFLTFNSSRQIMLMLSNNAIIQSHWLFSSPKEVTSTNCELWTDLGDGIWRLNAPRTD